MAIDDGDGGSPDGDDAFWQGDQGMDPAGEEGPAADADPPSGAIPDVTDDEFTDVPDDEAMTDDSYGASADPGEEEEAAGAGLESDPDPRGGGGDGEGRSRR